MQTDLSSFNNSWYKPGGGRLKRALWFAVNGLFFRNSLNPFSGLKCQLLRCFGAKVGKGVNIKPAVNIKYPWRLTIGNYSWIGENVWIDNLDEVIIGDNCCISQGAMLLCGNHSYKKSAFDLIIGKIILEDGAWVGAHATVCPNVTIKTHAVLSVGSVATKDLDSYTIYRGNPAMPVRERVVIENYLY
jgi:putative colanic acid biosynthesis acetyltransferase WcaF